MPSSLMLLLSLSMVMGLASFLAGSLPLLFSLSTRKMRLITACGTGVLVGTALIVVIPEGVETLYASARSIHPPGRGRSLPSTDASLPDIAPATRERRSVMPGARDAYGAKDDYNTKDDDALPKIGDLPELATPAADEKPAMVAAGPPTTPMRGGAGHRAMHAADVEDDDNDDEYEPHAWIGISVISGFMLMYMIDQLPKVASGTSSSRRQVSYISMERLGLDTTPRNDPSTPGRALEPDDQGTKYAPSGRQEPHDSGPLTTGLVIHAAADGIALGASTTSSSPNLSMIIFLALIIHKAPAAFGLTAVLLRRNTSRRRIRTHLLIFSLAAPVGALAAWAAAQSVGADYLNRSDSATGFATGVLLLFSAGTFLYVAMHAMQDASHVQHDQDSANPLSDPYGAPASRASSAPAMSDLLAMMGGMLLPLMTQFGHHR